MHFNIKLLTISLIASIVPTIARLNGPCQENENKKGACVKIKDCERHDGLYVTGLCPDDPQDVQCCFKDAYLSHLNPPRSGSCVPEESCSNGGFLPGMCPGDKTVKLCVENYVNKHKDYKKAL